MLRWAAASVTHGESVMRYGVGRGLKFDPQGGHPGFALGTSDPLEQKVLSDHLRPGSVFYDIGANVGFFAVLGARLVGRTGKVYAFEPFPDTARIARENIERNGFTHAEVVEAAVSDHDGTSQFVISSANTNYHLPKSGDAEDAVQQGITVRTVLIDGLIEAGVTQPPAVVQIDAEGAELSVLRGMAKTVRQWSPVILCEVHWQEPKEFLIQCRNIVGGEDAYDIRRVDGLPMPTTAERFHLIMTPVTRRQQL